MFSYLTSLFAIDILSAKAEIRWRHPNGPNDENTENIGNILKGVNCENISYQALQPIQPFSEDLRWDFTFK